MVRLTINSGGDVRDVAGTAGHNRVKRGSKKAIRRCVAVVEAYHKRNEWVGGGRAYKAMGGRLKDAPTHPTKLTVRDNILRKSYTRRIIDHLLYAAYGSDLVYAGVHEYGYPPGNIPARPGIANTAKATADQLIKIMADDIKGEF